jgi:hypothetical protein
MWMKVLGGEFRVIVITLVAVSVILNGLGVRLGVVS